MAAPLIIFKIFYVPINWFELWRDIFYIVHTNKSFMYNCDVSQWRYMRTRVILSTVRYAIPPIPHNGRQKLSISQHLHLLDVGAQAVVLSFCTAAPAVNTTINSTATYIPARGQNLHTSTKLLLLLMSYIKWHIHRNCLCNKRQHMDTSSITVASGDVIQLKHKPLEKACVKHPYGVTVAGSSTSVCPTVTCFDKGMEGTAITRRTIRIYQMTTTGVTLVNTQTVDATGTIGWRIPNRYFKKTSVIQAKADVTAGTLCNTTESGKCESQLARSIVVEVPAGKFSRL